MLFFKLSYHMRNDLLRGWLVRVSFIAATKSQRKCYVSVLSIGANVAGGELRYPTIKSDQIKPRRRALFTASDFEWTCSLS